MLGDMHGVKEIRITTCISGRVKRYGAIPSGGAKDDSIE